MATLPSFLLPTIMFKQSATIDLLPRLLCVVCYDNKHCYDDILSLYQIVAYDKILYAT